MGVGRRSARRQAVFALYRQDLLNLSPETALLDSGGEVDAYSRELVLGTNARLQEVDQLLDQSLLEWPLERLGVLERSILRIAAYELLAEPSVPAAVVIAEAVNLAKRYCSVEAGALVNGVLGSLLPALAPPDQSGPRGPDEHPQ